MLISEMTDIGFTGTREGMNLRQIELMVYFLKILDNQLFISNRIGKIRFHHGMCVGSDEGFHLLVRENITQSFIIGHPPTLNAMVSRNTYCDEYREQKPYLERNHEIVDISQILISTPKVPEIQRSGTWATIRYARKTNKPIMIFE